ncbi:MAG: molybdenum cofactor biosynthesis protein MoaE [Deltaproteobacteria bacterium]|nr:molybdenum cofactor biosynthesis protein MoaE [Deltaproteobacteria bacterium]
MPNLQELVDKIKKEADPRKVGMIACHNGVVRATTRKGLPAEYLEIDVDRTVWEAIVSEMRGEPGIAAIETHLFTGKREVGDDVMLLAVAGDIRENVLPVLERLIDRLKKEAIIKFEKIHEGE